MSNQEGRETKRFIIGRCVRALEDSAAALKLAMDEAQKDANAHKGAMASRYDTFKEEAQALRNGYALQLDRIADALALMKRIIPQKSERIELGAIVRTTGGSYFVSTGLINEPVEVDGIDYQLVSYNSPLIQKLRECRVGESCVLTDGEVELTSIE